MISFTFKGKVRELPGQLEELSRDQYLEFLKLSSLMTQGLLQPSDFRVHWISVLLGLRTDYTIYTAPIRDEVSSQMSKIDGFFEYEEQDSGFRAVTPRLRSTKQMLKEYAGWIGPDDMLDGMTFGDFTDSLTLLHLIKKATDDGSPDSELSVLYEELTRKIYKPKESPQSNKKPIPPSLLTVHAVSFFTAVWSHIVNEPVNINGADINFAILFTGSSGGGRHGYDDQTGWKGIAFEVASSGVFGSLDSVNKTPFWDVLLYLYKAKYEYIHKKNVKSNHGKR